jgi:hypothetical protein
MLQERARRLWSVNIIGSGRILLLWVEPNETIQNVKQRIADLIGIPGRALRLFFEPLDSEELHDYNTLQDTAMFVLVVSHR